jgi:hypothetical protein
MLNKKKWFPQPVVWISEPPEESTGNPQLVVPYAALAKKKIQTWNNWFKKIFKEKNKTMEIFKMAFEIFYNKKIY